MIKEPYFAAFVEFIKMIIRDLGCNIRSSEFADFIGDCISKCIRESDMTGEQKEAFYKQMRDWSVDQIVYSLMKLQTCANCKKNNHECGFNKTFAPEVLQVFGCNAWERK